MKRSLRSWLWGVPLDQEVDEEIAFHLEMRTRELIARGMDPAAAREQALARAGDLRRLKRTCVDIGRKRDREMRLTQWLEEFRDDVKFALRQMKGSPGFTFVAALTLALGIGANSAMFALADATLLRPLPFQEPDRLVALFERTTAAPRRGVSVTTLEDLSNQSQSFDALAGIALGAGGGPLVTAPDGTADTVERQYVTARFFDVLGLVPVAGRTFRASDETPSPTVVIFSESLWRGRFNADPSLVGGTVKLNGVPHTLVGVVPDHAQLTRPARMWTLMPALPPFMRQRSIGIFEVVGRLKPGVPPDSARADVAAIAARIADQEPAAGQGFTLDMEPFRDLVIRPELQRTSLLLLGVVGFVLLMCCANVANLLLARTSARARELAVRTALGAGRGRVAAQMLTESLVLALAGGVLGVAVGSAILQLAPAVIPPGLLPPAVVLEFDARVVAFGLSAAVVVGIVFGLAPALHATSGSLLKPLATASRTSTGAGRFRSVLVSGEVAAAVVLLCGAGLLLRTLLVLVDVDPGYRVDGSRVLTLDFSLTSGPDTPRPTPEALLQFYADVARDVDDRPEVESVGWTSALPYGTTSELGFWSIEVVGDPQISDDERPRADVAVATDGYFRTLDLPMLAGRRFSDRDSIDAPAVCIVNDVFVRRVLQGRDPLGVRIMLQRTPQEKPMVREIVGVVRQTSGGAAERAESLQVYIPLWQFPWGDVYMVARASTGPAEALTPIVRSIVAGYDPNTPVRRDRTLEFLSLESTAPYRFRAAVVATFAALALVLAMIGVFGVLAYSVQQRRRELGVRIALGATASGVVRLVLAGAGRLIVGGVLIGLGAAAATAQMLSSFLFGVEPLDLATFCAVVVVLAITAAVAVATPAFRATRVDPLVALRTE